MSEKSRKALMNFIKEHTPIGCDLLRINFTDNYYLHDVRDGGIKRDELGAPGSFYSKPDLHQREIIGYLDSYESNGVFAKICLRIPGTVNNNVCVFDNMIGSIDDLSTSKVYDFNITKLEVLTDGY